MDHTDTTFYKPTSTSENMKRVKKVRLTPPARKAKPIEATDQPESALSTDAVPNGPFLWDTPRSIDRLEMLAELLDAALRVMHDIRGERDLYSRSLSDQDLYAEIQRRGDKYNPF